MYGKWKLLEISVLLQSGKDKEFEEENEKLESQLPGKAILVESSGDTRFARNR